jgi:putative peptidoglycan lipid II flippase
MLALFFAFDKGLGILRQIIISRAFGTTPLLLSQLDAFNAANNLPDLLFALISGGALGIAFIPVLTEYLTQKDRSAAWRLLSSIANLAFLITAGVAVIIAILSRSLVGWQLGIAPGFNSEQQILVVQLMRLNLFATLVFSISGLAMAGLQADQHFFLPALAPILYNIGQIFGAVILAPQTGMRLGPVSLPGFGLGIYGLVYGVILGAALHLGIQIPGLLRYGYRWTPRIGLNDPGVRQVLRLMGPRVLTMFFIQFTFLARDNMASRLEAGAVTALTYGWMIMQVPETLIGTAIGTAILPTLSAQAASKDWKAFRDTLERAIQVMLALTIPTAAVLAAGLGPWIIRVFGFAPGTSQLVIQVTQVYLFGIIAHSLIEVAGRAFYAQQEARLPLLASALNALAYLLMGILFFQPWGAVGISLANTLSFTGEALLLLYWHNRRLKEPLQLRGSLLRTVLGSVVGMGCVVLILRFLPIPALVSSALAMLVGAAVCLPWIWKDTRALLHL